MAAIVAPVAVREERVTERLERYALELRRCMKVDKSDWVDQLAITADEVYEVADWIEGWAWKFPRPPRDVLIEQIREGQHGVHGHKIVVI